MSLREAASVVFGLAAVLPILLFVYLLAHANLLAHTDVQIGLLCALVVSVLGFVVFRRMVGQVARLADGLQAPAGTPVVAAASVPGLGQVTEISQVTGAFYQMLQDLRGATQRLEDLVFKLGTLNETVELAARIPRIQDLLGQVLQTTMRAVHATVGTIMILDPESQTLRLAASRGMPEDTASEAEVKMGDGVAGRVAQTGEPVQVDDVEADARFRGAAACYGNGSYICMPIRAGDRIIGVINMAKRREAVEARAPSFSAIDLQFLNTLMTYIGYAVDNARLLEEAQESARRLQTVVDDLRTTQEQLVRGETLRAMGQLASGMAHHVNNLFAVVLGRTELLLGSAEGSSSARRSLEIIHRAAEDGADVTRRVQRFSRLHPLSTPVAVDLNRLAVDVLDQTRSRWQDETDPSGPRFDVKIEPGPIPLAVGELAPVREILVNVLVNALDAMPEGGSARLRTWVDGERVRCAISDTGVGMSDEVRRRALQPFFTTKGPKSTGLGLSVAYGALQRYGGSLEIASESGRGTTIIISLPVAAPPEAADGPQDHLAAPVLDER